MPIVGLAVLYPERKPSVQKSDSNLFPDTDVGKNPSSKKEGADDDEAEDEEMGEENTSDPDGKNSAEEISLETIPLSEDVIKKKEGEESNCSG